MNSNDLFSFLDEDGVGKFEKEPNNQFSTAIPQKRKEVTIELSADSEDVHSSGESSPKKPRLCAQNPIVLDDFETEAKREVEASAGLTGTAEVGARLELRHQVLHHLVILQNLLKSFRFDIKWPFL